MADQKPKFSPPKQDPKRKPKQAPPRKTPFVSPTEGPGISAPRGLVPIRGQRKIREGIVVSDKMNKTIVVMVEDRVKHTLYGKVVRRTSRLHVHDEANDCGVGDRVRVMETRPLSRLKRWRLIEIVERAK